MFSKILPKEVCFFDYFEEHSGKVLEGCKEFQIMVSNTAEMDAHIKRIEAIEQSADDITHKCVDMLRKTFITPFDRDDIFRLIKRMDDIMDGVYAASLRMSLYDLNTMRPEVPKLAEILVQCAGELNQALKYLRSMKNSQQVIERCNALHRMESQGADILHTALSKLFREESYAIMVIKWKEIFEHLEKSTGRCKEVANIIEGIIIEAF